MCVFNLCITSLISICKTVNGHCFIPHTNFVLTTFIQIFELIDDRFNVLKRFFGRGHVTDDSIKLINVRDILSQVLFPCRVASSLASN